MINLQSLLTLGFIVATSTSAFAGQTIEVQSLNNGSCWAEIHEGSPDRQLARLVSFGSGFSGVLNQQALLVNRFYKNLATAAAAYGVVPNQLEGREFEVYFHCHSSGHQVVLNFTDREPKLCVTGTVQPKSGVIDQLSIASNSDGVEGKPCFGSKVGFLIGSPKPGEDINRVVQDLAALPMVANATSHQRFFEVILTQEWHLKEAAAIRRVLSEPSVGSRIRNLQTNNMGRLAGESTKLFNLTVPTSIQPQ